MARWCRYRSGGVIRELRHYLSWLTCICRIPSCCDRPHRFSRWGLPMPRPPCRPRAGARLPTPPTPPAGLSPGPSGGMEGVESRARRARSGEGRACRPRPRAPSPARPGRPDRLGSSTPVAASRLPGAHARGPPSRRAWPLRSPSVKARHAPSPQIPPLRSGIGGDAGGVPPPARTGL